MTAPVSTCCTMLHHSGESCCACREVMDSMYRPYNFHKTFFGSYSYVFTLVIPNTLFVYWGFPAEARQYGMLSVVSLCPLSLGSSDLAHFVLCMEFHQSSDLHGTAIACTCHVENVSYCSLNTCCLLVRVGMLQASCSIFAAQIAVSDCFNKDAALAVVPGPCCCSCFCNGSVSAPL